MNSSFFGCVARSVVLIVNQWLGKDDRIGANRNDLVTINTTRGDTNGMVEGREQSSQPAKSMEIVHPWWCKTSFPRLGRKDWQKEDKRYKRRVMVLFFRALLRKIWHQDEWAGWFIVKQCFEARFVVILCRRTRHRTLKKYYKCFLSNHIYSTRYHASPSVRQVTNPFFSSFFSLSFPPSRAQAVRGYA